MKKKILMIIVISVIITSFIYMIFKTDKKTYLALGDSIARGISPFGKELFSYNDYVVEHMRNKNILEIYYREFTSKNLRTNDLVDMIQDNYELKIENKKVTIQQALAKADIITLSIGSYDLYNYLRVLNGPTEYNKEELNRYFLSMFTDLNNLIELINKFTTGRLIIIGFYNPNINSDEELDSIFRFIDESYRELAIRNNSEYISLNEFISKNNEYIPNVDSVLMNHRGHQAISEKIIELLNF